MSLSTSVDLKVPAIGCLTSALIACAGLIIVMHHFQQHHVRYKQVKLFAVLALSCMLMLNLIAGITMNSSIFTTLHQNHDIISISNCRYMLLCVSIFSFLSRYFMIAFSLSRLRYFFNSNSLALNVTVYHGWLISYAIFSFLVLIFIFFILNATVLSAVDNDKIQKCHPDSITIKIYAFYLAVVEGFMQCILLYLYYKKYRRFRLVHCADNIGDKYIKKHVVKRSLSLGMIAIISTWICGVMVMMRTPRKLPFCFVPNFIVQICAIIFSFDICSNGGPHGHGQIELVDVSGNELSRGNEEYLAKIMAAYRQNPRC